MDSDLGFNAVAEFRVPLNLSSPFAGDIFGEIVIVFGD